MTGAVTVITVVAAPATSPPGHQEVPRRAAEAVRPLGAWATRSASQRPGQYLPLAVPDYNRPTPDADYYVIALVQTQEQMHSDLPPTLVREYVQL